MLPAENHRSPCQSAANCFGHDEVAGFDLAALDANGQGQGNRCSRRIAVILHGEHDAIEPTPIFWQLI